MNDRTEEPKVHLAERHEQAAIKAAENLSQCAFAMSNFDRAQESRLSKPEPVNIEKESKKIADNLSHGNNPDKISAAVNRLSFDLKQMAGDMAKYNELIKAVDFKVADEPVSNPVLEYKNFNNKTGTWDNVTIYTYDLEKGDRPAFRIVQPGNTLSQIAKDMKGELPEPMTTARYMDYLQKINKMKNPNKIFDGQAIKLREDINNNN